MGTTLPGINQLPSLQSFSMNKENRYPSFQNNNNHMNESYFELKPTQIANYHTPPTIHGSSSTPNNSYHQPQILHQYIQPHGLQGSTLPTATRQNVSMSIYQPPLMSPTETQTYIRPLRSQSQDSNLRLPSIQQLVSPASTGQEIFPQSQPFTQQIHMPTAYIQTSAPSHQYTYSPPHSLHHVSHIQPKKIRKRTRTGGCLTCRKRRIKCDERKPGCMNCEKSKKCCAGYVDVTKKKK